MEARAFQRMQRSPGWRMPPAAVIVIAALVLLAPAAALAERLVTVVEPRLVIPPGEQREVKVMADPDHDVSRLFWRTVAGTLGGESCASKPCVRVTLGETGSTYDTFNMGLDFEGRDDEMALRFQNLADSPVTIEIERIVDTCSGEICARVASPEAKGWIVFRIQQIERVEPSEDGSFMRITGKTVRGRAFDALFVDWLTDPGKGLSCRRVVPRWVERPEKSPPPYILAGALLEPKPPREGDALITLLDTCTANGTKFNAGKDSDFDFRDAAR